MKALDKLQADMQKMKYSIPDNLFRDCITIGIDRGDFNEDIYNKQKENINKFLNGENLIFDHERMIGSTSTISAILTYIIMKEKEPITVLFISHMNLLMHMKHYINNILKSIDNQNLPKLTITSDSIRVENGPTIYFKTCKQTKGIKPDILIISDVEYFLNEIIQYLNMMYRYMNMKPSKYGKLILEYKKINDNIEKKINQALS